MFKGPSRELKHLCANFHAPPRCNSPFFGCKRPLTRRRHQTRAHKQTGFVETATQDMAFIVGTIRGNPGGSGRRGMLDTGVVFIDRYCNRRALLLPASASPAFFTDRQLAISACLRASRPTTLSAHNLPSSRTYCPSAW